MRTMVRWPVVSPLTTGGRLRAWPQVSSDAIVSAVAEAGSLSSPRCSRTWGGREAEGAGRRRGGDGSDQIGPGRGIGLAEGPGRDRKRCHRRVD
jgi:hypothetical protein